MKIFADTSVVVAAVLKQHSHHQSAFPVLNRVQNGTDFGFISAHSLAEMYSTLTKLPPPFRHSPEQALFSIEKNVLNFFKACSFSASDYANLLRHAAAMGVQGGTIYYALLMLSAEKANVARIYTFNVQHFQAVAPPNLLPLIFLP